MFRVIEGALQDKNFRQPRYYGPYETYDMAKEKQEEIMAPRNGFQNGTFVGLHAKDGVWFMGVEKDPDQDNERNAPTPANKIRLNVGGIWVLAIKQAVVQDVEYEQ